METNTRVEPIPCWDELSKNFTRMITKDSTKDNKNDIDIVLDHNNFWDNPTQPEPKHNVRQIKTYIVYTEEEVEKLCYDAIKERDYTPWCVFQEWFNQNKKK